jgi:rhodanese-related sulfurtransferase
MSFETTNPTGARQLLTQEAWTFLDVRTVEEFQAGHVPGAYNVPLLHRGPAGMSPNPNFLEVVGRHFSKDTPLVLGCKIGARSERACELLAAQGWTRLANMNGGFEGRWDGDGSLIELGWTGCEFPTSTEPEAGRSWTELAG